MEEESQNGGSATPTKELAVAVEEEEPMVGPGPPRGKRKRPLHSDHSLSSAKRPLFTHQMNSSSSLSLTSPPSSSLSGIWKHDVFPSFHGPDVRRTFFSHVREEFKSKGIDLFIDNQIQRGKSIGPELVEAIRGSKIAIVLLSKNYASSSWCLDELAEIMKCREAFGQIVLTIFYEVEPTDVRKQTGDFENTFRNSCKGKTKEHIERWRKALEDVAEIAGEHSRKWDDEADGIKKIATDVSNILINSSPSRDFDDLVGMEAHMERMKQLLSLDLDEVRMIGIWGPPGIGKTTIARFMFNQFSSRFQFVANMMNIKTCYPTPCLDEEKARQLQSQMLSQIINQKDIVIPHLGVAQERLKYKKVFLVLDDVDHLRQLHALAKEIQWFGPGSRIIITTKDRGVLKAHGIEHIYKVNLPSSEEALQIFCMHAFGQKHPDDGFNELAREVTNRAGKLPLGLKVMGSALRGMSKEVWGMGLPCLDGEIESIIKFSYDTLRDEEKYLFLYIACLYSFQIPRKVEELLSKQIEGVRQRLKVLTEKSLISIGPFGKIEMHTLLVQFGIKTSREQFIVLGRAKHQLLVGEKDICEVLSDDTTDNRRFIGINLDVSKINEELDMSEKALETMSALQFPLRNLKWMDLSDSIDLKELPDLSTATNLKELDLSNCSNLAELPSIGNAAKLEELILDNCSSLVKLPSSINATNLQEMSLRNCSCIVELPDIENMSNLWKLELENCSSLRELPPSIGTATNLQGLDISGCSSLVKLPSSIGDITNLTWFYLSNCSSLLELPPSIGAAKNLEELDISGCSSIVKLPSSIGDITSLTRFDLSNCSSLLELPPSIGTATNLEELNISGCPSLVKLPSSIGDMTNLKELDLSNCSNLAELPSIGNAAKLEELILDNCSSLVKLPSSINATNLQEMSLRNCSCIVELPAIENMSNLWKLELKNCSSLQEVPPSIGTATNLRKLDISGCSSLVKLPSSIGDITNLKEFDLSNCSSLVELPSSIGNLQHLEVLSMCGCSKLEALPTNINLESLKKLDLTNCSQFTSFPEISTNIWYLSLIGTAISDVPLSIMSWSYLPGLEMSYFESLDEFLHALDLITVLHLNEDIQEVGPWVKEMSRLGKLRLYNCNNLVSLPQLLDSLSYIDADNCKSLERLDCSFNNPNICLKFTNCFKLNQEARDLIMHTSTRKHAILPGTQVPACFDYRASAGGPLTIKLNERHLSKSLRFKACIMLVKENTSDDETWRSVYTDISDKQNGVTVLDQKEIDADYVSIKIMDKQNDLTVHISNHGGSLVYIGPLLTEHIYTFEVEAEEVTSTELVFEFKTGKNKLWKIGECGLYQIMEAPSC